MRLAPDRAPVVFKIVSFTRAFSHLAAPLRRDLGNRNVIQLCQRGDDRGSNVDVGCFARGWIGVTRALVGTGFDAGNCVMLGAIVVLPDCGIAPV